MPFNFNDVFRKSVFGQGFFCFIISQILFYKYVYSAEVNSYSDKLWYRYESDVSEEFVPVVYHSLDRLKRAAENASTSNPLDVTDDTSTNKTETSTQPTTRPPSTINVTSEAPNTETANTLYRSENTDGAIDVKIYDHGYYKSYSKKGEEIVSQFWINLDNMPEEKVVSHESLSSAYRKALTVTLTFDFPFYGNVLNNITIATGGFLFTGSFLHKWLAATQYIAPLMANFDTSVSKDSMVKYADNGTSLTVQWEKVVLQDNPNVGPFTFQVTINQTGFIIFAYKDIPVVVNLIADKEHPVKVGLSDAYIVEKKVFYVRKKTIYEYHKISMEKDERISNWTAIIFEPLPICVSFHTCESCLTAQTKFQCQWCQNIGRCSDGLDRHRQIWLENQCMHRSTTNASYCAFLPPPSPSRINRGDGNLNDPASLDSDGGSSRRSLFVGLFLTLIIIVAAVGWATYAYLHPHTASGQILIKYRPSAWSWRRGEARYTAATMHSIHM